MCRRLLCLASILLTLGAILTNVASADITTGLVGYWKLDDSSGTTAVDSSGNGNHGTLVDGPEWKTAGDDVRIGSSALYFDFVVGGEHSYVDCGDKPEFDITDNITLALWVKSDGFRQSYEYFFSRDFGGGGYMIIRAAETRNLRVVFNGLSGQYYATGSTVVDDGQWHHIAASYDITTGDVAFYTDGALEVSESASGPLTISGLPLMIGGRDVRNCNAFIDDVRIYHRTLSADDILELFLYQGNDAVAKIVAPANDATDVPRDVLLHWTPGEFAPASNGHIVYLGETFDDVNDATSGATQDANSFDPGSLTFGTTYYWRVDEVNGAPDFTVYKGDTWSFTVEPFSYPIANVTATASSSQAADLGPEKTIDGSGLDDMDQHATLAPTMWLSGMGDAAPWIQYEFDRAYKLHQMLVWNSNQAIEAFVGLGAKDVTTETSVDGTAWTVLEGATLFSQATGTATYTANTTIDFAGTMAKYVRITINSGYGMVAQYGLSEVRFMFIPTSAREPQPADGATDGVDVMLAWRAGREAAQHEVVLSSDLAAVEDGSAIVATTQESMFSPAGLSYDTTYYWQINEVNEGATPTRHEGAIWSFSTPEYRVVDDFEGYNDDCDRLFFAWQDGFGHNGSEGIADCAVAPYNGNGTGSIVGHATAPFAERATVHSGKQSMPLEYDSAVSETTLALGAQNWTASGIQALSLSFHGVLGNTGQLYLKINSVELPFNGSAAAISSPFWTQWIAELGAVATDLTRVNSLTIGIKGASAPGMVYVDDIRLYAQAPGVLGPQDPGTDNLVAYYALENNAQDGSGNGHHGTVEGSPAWVSPGWDGTGACMQFGGDNDRITVESFDATGSGITLTAWIKPSLFLNDARMLSKSEGSSTADHYWAMVLSGSGENNLQFRLRTDAGATTSRTSGGSALALDEWTHVAVTWDASDPFMRQFKNGQEIDSISKAGNAVATAGGVKIGIGNQSVSAGPDPANMTRPFEGLMDEVRVYSRGLSEAELLHIASGL